MEEQHRDGVIRRRGRRGHIRLPPGLRIAQVAEHFHFQIVVTFEQRRGSALRLLIAHRETVARERALREDDDKEAVHS
jgi:hypothetical protein